MTEPLWQPTDKRIEQSNISAFRNAVNENHGLELKDSSELYQWSIEQPETFWSDLWDESKIIAQEKGSQILIDADKMPGATWFPDAKLNFAENLITTQREQASDAIVFWGEDQVKRRLSWGALHDQVSKLAQHLRASGITKGDRIAGFMPNIPETVVAMLATTSIGAIWSSCSPDFGVNGVADRFGQIEPKVLFTADGYFYNGKAFDCLEKIADIQKRIPSLEKTIVISYTREEFDLSDLQDAEPYSTAIDAYEVNELIFEQVAFDHPLYIMFSSGTTGVPKCIVHGTGGTLIQHIKEHRLHSNVSAGDRVFYFTTCGWMMWNWLVSGLAVDATLLLYDGSPFYPSGEILFDYADAEGMTLFGTSAKYIDALKKAELNPMKTHNLSTVQAICSTGSPLVPEAFEYVYDAIKSDVCLSSISGGTDIISCFALGNPTLPVYRGELQSRGFGMQVEVWSDNGEPISEEKGELVCTAPFPSMPVGFWNDPDGAKYHSAYFERFPNIWCHGDYVELTSHDGIIIYGRSDAILNPGGVRIGTAEIYRQVEQLNEVVESIVIGQEWDDDVRVVLFVTLQPEITLNNELISRIKKQIRANTTPRHVPAKVIQVNDIPRTKSGKIVELAVRDVVHGRAIKNKEALANPEALDAFADREELKS